MKRDREHAAEFLQQLLKEQNITGAELSRRTGIDAGILRSIAAGKRKSISTRNLAIIARYCGISIRELLDKID